VLLAVQHVVGEVRQEEVGSHPGLPQVLRWLTWLWLGRRTHTLLSEWVGLLCPG
jgi:hypothetical protein